MSKLVIKKSFVEKSS